MPMNKNDGQIVDIVVPDAAFAIVHQDGDEVIRLLEHHTSNVDKGTENGTVDVDMLKTSISKLDDVIGDSESVAKAKLHLMAHAVALDIDVDSGEEMSDAQVAQSTLLERIEYADSIDEVEQLLIEAMDAKDENAVSAAEYKIDQVKSDGRELLSDSFEFIPEILEKNETGEAKFKAKVAQVDKINKNRRLYPRAEMENNIPRVNRLIKAGKLWGMDGHPGFFSAPKPSEICIRYDAFSIVGDNVYLEGAVIPTSIGSDIITLWEHGVETEWSIIGYGNAEEKKDVNNKPYLEITDYVFEGCDIVTRGAANTKTIKWTKDSTEIDTEVSIEETEEEPIMSESVEKNVDVVEKVDTKNTETVNADAQPAIDMSAVTNQLAAFQKQLDSVMNKDEDKVDVTAMATEAVTAAFAAKALADAKANAIAKLAGNDATIAMAISDGINRCTTLDEIAECVEKTSMPIVERMKPAEIPTGVGVITSKKDERKKFMSLSDGKVIDRPRTAEGVKQALLEGIEDNGKREWSNPKNVFEAFLTNYANSVESNLLDVCTEYGYKQWADATTTTTTALGTQQPMILPLLRQIFPMLLPVAISSTQPMSRPTSEVYFMDFQYASGDNASSSLDDSAAFDSRFSDHTEGEAKSQIKFELTSQSLTAVEKSIMYSVTSNLIQDLQSTQGLDAEQILMQTAGEQIAREINLAFVGMITDAVTETATFGTVKPATWEDQGDWEVRGLTMFLNKLSGKVASKTGQACNVLICDTDTATMFSSMSEPGLMTNPVGQTEFGMGIKKEATNFLNRYDVYSHAWYTENTILMGYRPPSWDKTGAVFAPYIPLYIGPRDYNAELNVAQRSLSSRYAQKVLNANAFAKLTIARGEVSADPWATI